MTVDVAQVLASEVSIDGKLIAFAAFSAAQVSARAAELAGASGFGHGNRVGAVAIAWRQLARAMDEAGAERVEQLDPAVLARLAEGLWVVPPGGSLLR